MLGLYDLNFYEYEMLIERELCLYFTAFLKTVNNVFLISLTHWLQNEIACKPFQSVDEH